MSPYFPAPPSGGDVEPLGLSEATKAALEETYAAKSAEAEASVAHTLSTQVAPPVTSPVSNMWVLPLGTAHGITSSGTGTFDLQDTTDFAMGDRSVRATIPNTGTQPAATFTKNVTIDATARYLRLWVKVDDITRIHNMVLTLRDTVAGGYFYSTFHTYRSESSSLIRSGEWTAIDIPWSDLPLAFSATRQSVNQVQVTFTGRGSLASGPVIARLGGVAGITEQVTYPNGVVSLTFDDSFSSAYTEARPYMDKYGYAGSLFPVQDQIGQPGKLTLAQAKSLVSTNGWEFGYHASTQALHDAGFHTMTEAQFAAECEKMILWGKNNGLGGESFTWPLGLSSSATERVASKYFRVSRGSVDTTNESLPPSQPHRLRTYKGSTDLINTLKAKVDKAKSGKSWAILDIGDVVYGNNALYVNPTSFQSLIDHINTQGVAVATIGQVMNRLKGV